MGRLPDGELSKTSRAIKWRANKTVQNAEIALEKQGATELIISGERVMPAKPKKPKPAADAIGVFVAEDNRQHTSEDMKDAPGIMRDYHCMNCRATVHQGDEACGVCEQRLNWAGI